MKNKTKLLFLLTFATTFICCSSDSPTDSELSNKPTEQKESMWAALHRKGIPDYFDSLAQEGIIPINTNGTIDNRKCKPSALKMDENTRYLEELEILFNEGELVEGICGNGLKLHDGQVAPLGINLIDSLRIGTIEFWFKPNEDFLQKDAWTILGNDDSRLHFFYKNGNLIFQMNHANLHFFASGKADFLNDWNLIAGQWGDGYLSVWLNGILIAKIKHDLGYVPSSREKKFENLLVIGYKSSCCMEGPEQYQSLTTSGSFDQIKISNIPRYQIIKENVDVLDTTTKNSVLENEIEDKDSTVNDSLFEENVENKDSVFTDSSSVKEEIFLWNQFNEHGLSQYFDEKGVPATTVSAASCSTLVFDENTKYLDDLESIYAEGRLVEGVCGQAIALQEGEVVPLGINLIDSLSKGTVEFYFRPDEKFYENEARTLLGNNGSRLHFLYKNGNLIFQKNHPDVHYYVEGQANLLKGWNKIAGQWGDGYMSIWLNDKLVAKISHNLGYEPSFRKGMYENVFLIGFKSDCCMEKINLNQSLKTSGSYDRIRVSNVTRYNTQEAVNYLNSAAF